MYVQNLQVFNILFFTSASFLRIWKFCTYISLQFSCTLSGLQYDEAKQNWTKKYVFCHLSWSWVCSTFTFYTKPLPKMQDSDFALCRDPLCKSRLWHMVSATSLQYNSGHKADLNSNLPCAKAKDWWKWAGKHTQAIHACWTSAILCWKNISIL